MTPVVQLYWMRVALGIVAAVLTAFVALLGNPTEISTLLNCVSLAVIVYFISYYVLKAFYRNKIEKQSKILSTGIGMYFFSWLAFLVLFYSTIRAFMPV